jgi:hypothetical protein
LTGPRLSSTTSLWSPLNFRCHLGAAQILKLESWWGSMGEGIGPPLRARGRGLGYPLESRESVKPPAPGRRHPGAGQVSPSVNGTGGVHLGRPQRGHTSPAAPGREMQGVMGSRPGRVPGMGETPGFSRRWKRSDAGADAVRVGCKPLLGGPPSATPILQHVVCHWSSVASTFLRRTGDAASGVRPARTALGRLSMPPARAEGCYNSQPRTTSVRVAGSGTACTFRKNQIGIAECSG